MKTVVFERDYSIPLQGPAAALSYEEAAEKMRALGILELLEQPDAPPPGPREVTPEHQANYEHTLALCCLLARRQAGRVRVLVDRVRWECTIQVDLRRAIFELKSDLALLADVTEHSLGLTFSPRPGGVSMEVRLNYFTQALS